MDLEHREHADRAEEGQHQMGVALQQLAFVSLAKAVLADAVGEAHRLVLAGWMTRSWHSGEMIGEVVIAIGDVRRWLAEQSAGR